MEHAIDHLPCPCGLCRGLESRAAQDAVRLIPRISTRADHQGSLPRRRDGGEVASADKILGVPMELLGGLSF